MPPLPQADAKRVRDIVDTLGTLREGAPAALETTLDDIRAAIGAEKGVAYGLSPRGDSLALDFAHTSRLPRATVHAVLERTFQSTPFQATFFNPFRPETRQRNRALLANQLTTAPEETRQAGMVRYFPQLGLSVEGQLRVLVCEGPSLLAWVGGFRPEPFQARDRQVLQALVPALQRRLRLERQLGLGPVLEVAMTAAMEHIPAPAFIVRAGGAPLVLHANAAGQCQLAGDRARLEEALRAAVRGGLPSAYTVTRLTGTGTSGYFLAVGQPPADDALPRAAAAARRWGLTPRQHEVLTLLARGWANKTIAAALQCAENTVELHVTALLEKSGCGGRSELVARVWSGA